MYSEQITSTLDMIRHILTMFHAHWILKAREERKSLSQPTLSAFLTQKKTDLAAHFPDMATFNGMLDVFHLCVIADMGAILYAPRYQGDVVNYSDKHRKAFIRCRDLAHQILQDLDSSHILGSVRQKKVSKVYLKFLVKQVQAFWHQQITTRPSGPKHPDAIAEAIARCFHGNELFWKRWAKHSQPEHRSSLRYGFDGDYSVHQRTSEFHGKPLRLSPTSFIHSFTELFYPNKKTSPEEEDDDDELDPETRIRITDMLGWAKT
jgi:hypothetical protein